MWSHYASGFYGAAIGIDPEHVFFSSEVLSCTSLIKRPFFPYRPVSYAEERLKMGSHPTAEEMSLFLYTKTRHWSVENEYRALLDLSDSASTYLGHADRRYVDVPIGDDVIKEVILGPGFILKASEAVIDEASRRFGDRLSVACPSAHDAGVSIIKVLPGELQYMWREYQNPAS